MHGLHHRLVEFLLFDFAHRNQHDEKGKQQRHHVAKGDYPFRDAATIIFFFDCHAGLPLWLLAYAASLSLSRIFGGRNVLSYCSTSRGITPD